jgi:hypothetical protein
VFLREGYAGYVGPCLVLVLQIASFLPSVRGLEFVLFDGSRALLQSQEALSLCALWRAGLLAPVE